MNDNEYAVSIAAQLIVFIERHPVHRYELARMIKALLLIFLPIPTWEQIASIQRKVSGILLAYLLPLLVITTSAECFSLVRWGKVRGQIGHVTPLPASEAVVYGVGRILFTLVIVFVIAKLIKSLGETFHGRHSIHQVFTLAAYGLSPIFLLRIVNIFPGISPWVTWGVGMILSASVLYYGIPIIMKPDPPHAFGLYLMTVLLTTIVTGLMCFMTYWYLRGKFVKVDALISNLGSHLPF